MTDPVLMLLRRWKLIALIALAGAAAGAAYYLLVPRWYEAKLTVIPQQASPGIGALGAGGDLLGSLDLGGALGGKTGERIASVLQSRSVSDAVIHQFDLKTRYQTPNLEKTREMLWSLCAVEVAKKSELVTLSCEDKDPKFVRDMVAHFGKVGNETFRRVSSSTAGEERRFLEGQVAEAKRLVDESSQALRAFQEKHGIVDIAEQGKAVVSAMASLEGQRISKELELAYLNSFSSPGEASQVQLRQQIRIMNQKIDDLMQRRTDAPAKAPGGAKEVFPPAMDLPNLRYELERLYRDQKVRETVYLLVTQRYELAKADEVRETSAFQVLDEPVEPTWRKRPRLRVVPIGFAAGLVLAVLLILIPAWWRALDVRARLERA